MEEPLILDRYRPLSVLGEGGFGTVVLAWDTRMQRRVAIKRMPKVLDRFGEPTDTGLAEARTAALLNHTAIVTVYEYDVDEDEAFLIMEAVDGVSLADILDAGDAPLEWSELSVIAHALAGALIHAHDNGVLHLDIKPDNVLISRDGVVKMTDFGLAELSGLAHHLDSDGEPGVRSSWSGATGGTVGYMPPEQEAGEPVDERTDIWAFGTLLAEMIDDLEAPESIALAAALAENPTDRFKSVRALVAAIADIDSDLFESDAEGTDLLAERVAALLGDEGVTPRSLPPADLGLWDLAGATGRAATNLTAALVHGWAGWAGLSAMGLQSQAVVGGTAFVAIASALAPTLGSALGFGLLIAGVFAFGAPIAGTILLVALVPYWILMARTSRSAAILPLAAPAFGLAHVPLAAPLLAGFDATPGRAAIISALAAVFTLVASAASGMQPPYVAVSWDLLSDPWSAQVMLANTRALVAWPAGLAGSVSVIVSWALAGALMSLACARASRLWAVAGCVLAAIAMGTGYGVAGLPAAPSEWFGSGFAQSLVGSLILMSLVIAAGPPLRAEEE